MIVDRIPQENRSRYQDPGRMYCFESMGNGQITRRGVGAFPGKTSKAERRYCLEHTSDLIFPQATRGRIALRDRDDEDVNGSDGSSKTSVSNKAWSTISKLETVEDHGTVQVGNVKTEKWQARGWGTEEEGPKVEEWNLPEQKQDAQGGQNIWDDAVKQNEDLETVGERDISRPAENTRW